MKITIVQGPFLPVPPVLGGAAEKAWFALGKEFATRGHQVTHISRHFDGFPRNETIDGVKNIRVRGQTAIRSLVGRIFLDLLYVRRALRAAPEADILVSNTFWLPIIYRGIRKGRPYVHVARYPKGQLGYYSHHAILQTVSGPIRGAIEDQCPKQKGRVTVIPYPLPAGYFTSVPNKTSRTFLYAGRLHPEKGLELLMKAFARVHQQLPDWKLRVIGPHEFSQGGGGPDFLVQLKQLAGTAPVQFAGPVFEEAALIREYDSSSVFVYPSLAEKGETFGLALLEAMARGNAVICSNLGCFTDFIQHQGNGFSFDHRAPNTREILASAMLSLAGDEPLRRRLAFSAREGTQKYALQPIADRFLEDFSRQLHSSPA